jgi:TM2 domain-containing membrane protein YozV
MSGKNKVTAALLAILLGGIGAHKFYLGQSGVGIAYLLFCWTGIPLIIGIIEGLMLLAMDDQAFADKYN